MTLLSVQNVVKIFGELTALSGVDFEVAARQFHGLVGPNGSGKSTLMKCIAGAETPTRGSIRFDDADVTADPPHRRARHGLSIKFQITSVLPALSVYDNVLMALQARGSTWSLMRSASRAVLHDSVMEALDRFRLVDRADDLAGILSHGQQQWLEIAMALAPQPKLLLLDEPTAGMSLEERRVTGELLMPIRDTCSLVIVEHDLDFIRDFCDVITVLDQGAVIGSGTVEEIQNNQRVQEVYLSRV